MTEKEYHDACADFFAQLEKRLDEFGADYDNNGSVLEIVNDDDEKIIVNKQTPKREIWLASKHGGQHFVFADGDWRDTRDGSLLWQRLDALL